jgi:hypothetical protein
MWIAMRRLRVKRNDVYVDVDPGDPVPEAEGWKNRKALIRLHKIKWIDSTTDIVQKKVKKQKNKKSDTAPKIDNLASVAESPFPVQTQSPVLQPRRPPQLYRHRQIFFKNSEEPQK